MEKREEKEEKGLSEKERAGGDRWEKGGEIEPTCTHVHMYTFLQLPHPQILHSRYCNELRCHTSLVVARMRTDNKKPQSQFRTNYEAFQESMQGKQGAYSL